MDNNFNFDGDKMKKFLVFLALIFLAGCISSEPQIKGFKSKTFIANEGFQLSGQVKEIKAGQKLRVYIDGNAVTKGIFRKRPALPYPVAAELAQKDKYPYILYLNRPCYFIDNDKCSPEVWEIGRYLPEVIDEMSEALVRIQLKYRIPEFEFVGYDGGAAVALLLATRMKNTPVKVYTVGGILNTSQYAILIDEEIHSDSLNPATEGYSLSNIPQVHFVGAKDKQVPLALTKDYVKRIPNPVLMQIKSYPSADHFNWANFKIEY